MASLFGAHDRLAQLLSQRRQANQQEQRSLADVYANLANNKVQAGWNRTGASFGAGLGQGFAEGLFGESPEVQAARQATTDEAEVTKQIEQSMGEPNQGGRYKQIARRMAELGYTEQAIQFYNRGNELEQVEQATQYEDIFRATEQAVREEVDPDTNPTQYYQLMAERLGDSRNPLANREAVKYREKAIEFSLAEAKARAESNNVEYDAPESNEVKSAGSFIQGSPQVKDEGHKIKEADLNAMSVELASRTKDFMAENPNLTYTQARAGAWEQMNQDGTAIKTGEGFFGLEPNRLKYAAGTSSTPKPTKSEENPKEVIRMVDGRKVVYDAETKQPLRYAD